MKYNPEFHHRRSIRLKGYDYSQTGTYFVTICTKDRECLFGDIKNGSIVLTDFGKIVFNTWCWLASQYDYVILDEHVIMPNHIHGILVLGNRGDDTRRGGSRTARTSPTRTSTAHTSTCKTLGRIIGAFKTVSTKQINKLRDTPGIPIWQRNYYERIVRNEKELLNIREYIMNNPSQWEQDQDNPVNFDAGLGDV